MRLKNYAPFLIIILIFSACKKDKPVTQEVKFTSTTYETLGTYDSYGKPNYLLPKDTITDYMYTLIESILQGGRDLTVTHPELFNNSAIADIKITQPSDVYITFVTQEGGYTNSFAFYTYPSNQPPVSTTDIKTMTYIFPNSGNHTTLSGGDKVKLGRFNAGTSIGFVLLQEGWDSSKHTLDNNVVHFLSNDVLNPEVDPKLKKHAVLINDSAENKVLIGFEDVDRTKPNCDNDFNDVIFYCTVTP